MARRPTQPEQGARHFLVQLARIWRSPVLARIQCVVNLRLSVSLGRYRRALRTIESNARMFRAAWRLRREVLRHEAAHATVRWRFGPSAKPHGPEWRNLMRRAASSPGLRFRAAANGSAQWLEAPNTRAKPRRAPLPRLPIHPIRSQAGCPVALRGCVAAGLDGAHWLPSVARERDAMTDERCPFCDPPAGRTFYEGKAVRSRDAFPVSLATRSSFPLPRFKLVRPTHEEHSELVRR